MSEDKKEFDAEANTAEVRDAVVAAPPPGRDPDSRQRMAKQLAAAGLDLPDGLSVDPVTDEDRAAYGNDTTPTDKAQKRAAAPDRVQGRTAPTRTKASE